MDTASARNRVGALWVVVGVLGGASQAWAAPEPGFQFREASGCAGLTLYTWNDERTEVLILTVDQSHIALPNGDSTFGLGLASEGVAVRVEMTDEPRDDFPYCSNEESTPVRPVVWTAASGRVRVTVARRPRAPFSPVTVQLERLVLNGPAGAQVRQRKEVRFTAAIGDPIR
ncbi:MAG: hypothetical protein AB7N65_11000 [Vicinamibacterales bacterium]